MDPCTHPPPLFVKVIKLIYKKYLRCEDPLVVPDHADGAPRVDDQHLRLVLHVHVHRLVKV